MKTITKHKDRNMTAGRFVRLPKDLDHQIQNYADQNGITMSYAIRRFCELAIYNISNMSKSN